MTVIYFGKLDKKYLALDTTPSDFIKVYRVGPFTPLADNPLFRSRKVIGEPHEILRPKEPKELCLLRHLEVSFVREDRVEVLFYSLHKLSRSLQLDYRDQQRVDQLS